MRHICPGKKPAAPKSQMASMSSEHQPEPLELREIYYPQHTQEAATPVIDTAESNPSNTTPHGPRESVRCSIGEQPRASETSITSSQVTAQPQTNFTRVWRSIREFFYARGGLLLKLVTILAFLVAIIALWPSITSASDGHKAALIAAWTARKDFIELCEAVSALYLSI